MREQSSHNKKIPLITSLLVLILTPLNTVADKSENASTASVKTNTCPTENTSDNKYFQPKAFSSDKINNTEISADFTHSNTDGLTSLDRNVIIEKHLLRIKADHVHFDQLQQELHISGNARIDTEALTLSADQGKIKINSSDEHHSSEAVFKNIKFFIPNSKLKGKAKNTHSSNSNFKQQSIFTDAEITSCDLLKPDWAISSKNIQLDHSEEYGFADDVVLRFKNIPFAYLPYMEFPISNKRRTGFLFPEIGSSSSKGAELSTPWYWNIAPNQDAILTPHYMEKRGLGIDTNYRYLTKSSDGELTTFYLPSDSITKSERYQVDYQHHSRFLSNLLFDINLQDISDSNYFNDFSSSVNSTSQTHLDRSATLLFNVNNWNMRALVQDIKTIDNSTPKDERPYERLPQLTINGDMKISNSPVLFSLDAELVEFTHDDEAAKTGTRLILQPGLRLPISGDAWFINPAIKLSHTNYHINNTNAIADRNLVISSLDAGLFFERFLSNGYQHTLEPRLYYLNVPFKNQSDTPRFDTSTPDFSISQLFRENRFIGGDRIGDTNQLTLALTSRVINPNTGRELMRASIGQIFYFEDRKVSLDVESTPDTSNQSDLIAELSGHWGNWKSNIDLQLNIKNNELSKENYFLHYKSDNDHIFNIGYRKRLTNNILDIKQIDTSFVYAINHEYNSFVRWNYSTKNNKDIDSIAGISYNSCCWSIQLLAQRRLQNTTNLNNAYNNSILVQFIFKGLGSLSGNIAKNTLEQSIYGYKDTLH